MPIIPVLTSASMALKESIETSNRLSQVMDSQIQSQSASHGQITPPISRGTSYDNDKADGTKPFIPTSAEAILSEPDRTGYVIPTSLIPDEKVKGKGKQIVMTETSTTVSKTTEPTITPGMSDFEKSVIAQAMKEKSESEAFWERFAAAQPDREKLSVNHPWYQKIVGDFRAEQAAKAAKEKEERGREAALREALGPVKEKKRVRAGKWVKKSLKFGV